MKKKATFTLFLFLLAFMALPVTALTTFLEDFDGNTTLDGWGKHLQSGDTLEVSPNWGENSQYSMHIILDGYSPEQLQYWRGYPQTERGTIVMAVNSHEAYVKVRVYMTKGVKPVGGCLMWIMLHGTAITPEGPVESPLCSMGQATFGTDYGCFNAGTGQWCWHLCTTNIGTGKWYSIEVGFLRGASMYGKIAGATVFQNTAPAKNVTKIEIGFMVSRQTWSGKVTEGYIDNVEVRANGISPSQPTPPPNGNGNGNGNGADLPDWVQGILDFLGVDLMTFILICILALVVFILLFRTGR